jgi:uncharacterized protein YdaU (DUF1376 family)
MVGIDVMPKNPDIYFPLYGNVFWAAVDGYDEIVIVAYMRALWNYWHVLHCEGMENNSERLRLICRVSEDRWPDVYPVIFGKWFTNIAGAWHQKRALEEWQKSQAIMEKRSVAGKLGAKGKWKH